MLEAKNVEHFIGQNPLLACEGVWMPKNILPQTHSYISKSEIIKNNIILVINTLKIPFTRLRYVLSILGFFRAFFLNHKMVLDSVNSLLCIFWNYHLISTYIDLCDILNMLNDFITTGLKSTWSRWMVFLCFLKSSQQNFCWEFYIYDH